jgi:low affinity Fe/Cu permease
MQLKLDELIRAIQTADNSMLSAENMTEKELQELQERYVHLSKVAQMRLQEIKRG